MILFKTVKSLQDYIQQHKKQGHAIGFVPTMGALHQGHLSLIQQAVKNNDCAICSIFVNPTQFNDAGDLQRYPRTVEQDLALLEQHQTSAVFLPSVEEIYPNDLDTTVNLDLGTLDKFMEGEHRPGHFKGVVQVVKRLLDIVTPNRLYMGQKDFQQYSIIRYMVEQLQISTEVIRCPIVREPNGLAMSSRNVLLSEEEKKQAALISKTLYAAQKEALHLPLEQVKQNAIQKLSRPPFRLDYFEIANRRSLQPAASFDQPTVACTAVFLGKIRLIDNVMINVV